MKLAACAAVWYALLLGLAVRPPPADAQQSGTQVEEGQAITLATQLERAGREREAERVLMQLLDAQPVAARALAMLARLSAERGAPEIVLPYAEAAAAEAGYDRADVHLTFIRALLDSGLRDEAVERARAWVRARPSDPAAARQLSLTLAELGRADEAARVLLEARERMGDDDIFSQELGVLYASAGRLDDAANEWIRVLAWGDAGVRAVEARLETPGVDRGGLLAALSSALKRPSTGIGALRGGLDLALRLERGPWARRLVERILAESPGETQWQVLRKYYMAARDRGFSEDARWAAGRLAATATEPRDRLQWQAVEASVALDLGDREHARAAFERILEAAPEGSETRRLAINSLLILRAEEDDDRAEELIELHAEEFPDSEAELADMTIRLSRARVRRGDLAGARRALELAPSQPSNASTAARLEAQRGYLDLFAGRVTEAREHLETAGRIPGADPGERTGILVLLNVFSRADSADVAALGRGIFALRSGDGPEALLELAGEWAEEGSSSSSPSSSSGAAAPGLMGVAASALDRQGLTDAAKDVWRQMVDAFPDTPEASRALLALARGALPTRPDAAARWLRQLIIDHPDSALAPVARRLLSELENRVPGSAPPSGDRTRML